MTQPPCLIEALSGDRRALEELMAWCHPVVAGYLARLTGGRARACDLVQDVLVSVLESLESYRPTPGASFPAWVLRIARNRFIDSVRAAHQTVPVEEAGEPCSEGDATAGAALADIDARALREALERLKPADRELIELRYWFGFSHREASEVLGIRPQAVKSRLNAALGRLRKRVVAERRGLGK